MQVAHLGLACEMGHFNSLHGSISPSKDLDEILLGDILRSTLKEKLQTLSTLIPIPPGYFPSTPLQRRRERKKLLQ